MADASGATESLAAAERVEDFLRLAEQRCCPKGAPGGYTSGIAQPLDAHRPLPPESESPACLDASVLSFFSADAPDGDGRT